MTRRRWPGQSVDGSRLGKNTDARLMLTPLGVGQSPAIPMQMSGSGSGLILPMSPIWTPLAEIPIEPIPEENCITISGYANSPLSEIYPITPLKPCSITFCFNSNDITSEGIDDELPFFYGLGIDGWINGTFNDKISYVLNMNGQIFKSDIANEIYFLGNIPVFIRFAASEEDDPFDPGPPKTDIDEIDASQAGIYGRIAQTDGVWEVFVDDVSYGFYFAYYYEA